MAIIGKYPDDDGETFKVGDTHHLRIGPYYFVAVIGTQTPVDESGAPVFIKRQTLIGQRRDDDFGADMVFANRDWTNGQGLLQESTNSSSQFWRSRTINIRTQGQITIGPRSDLAPYEWYGGSAPLCYSGVNNSIIHWWPGDDSNDIAGSLNGTEHGVTHVAGKVDNAISFDGTDDYLEFSENYISEVKNYWTMEGWVKPGGPAGQNWWNDWRQTVASPFSAGVIGLAVGTDHIIVPWVTKEYSQMRSYYPNPSGSGWVHIAIVASGLGFTVYINGVSQGFAVGEANLDMYMGLPTGREIADSVSYFFNGQIDEWTCYDRNLTDFEIANIYNANTYGKCNQYSSQQPYIPFTPGWIKLVGDKLWGVGPMPGGGNENNVSLTSWDFSHSANGWTFSALAAVTALCSGISHDGQYLVGTHASGVIGNITAAYAALNDVYSICSDYQVSYGLQKASDTSSKLWNLKSLGAQLGQTMFGVPASANSMCWHNGNVWMLTVGDSKVSPRTQLYMWNGTNLILYKIFPEGFRGHHINTDGSTLYVFGQQQTDVVSRIVPQIDAVNPTSLIQGQTEVFYLEGSGAATDPLASLVKLGTDLDTQVWSITSCNTPFGLVFATTTQNSSDLYLINGVQGGISHYCALPAVCNGVPIDGITYARGIFYISFQQGNFTVTGPPALPAKYLAYVNTSNCADSGTVESSFNDFGLKSIPKVMQGISVVTPGLVGNEGSIKVSYGLDSDDTIWYPCSFNNGANSKIDYTLQETVVTENAEGDTDSIKYPDMFYSSRNFKKFVTDPILIPSHSIAYKLELSKGDISPTVIEAMIQGIQFDITTARRYNRKIWTVTIELGRDCQMLNGEIDPVPAAEKMEHLRKWNLSPTILEYEHFGDPGSHDTDQDIALHTVIVSQFTIREITQSQEEGFEAVGILELMEM